MENSIWKEIRNTHEYQGVIYIDAYLTDDENEDGRVIAKINISTGKVDYIDARAENDVYAQKVIQEALSN